MSVHCHTTDLKKSLKRRNLFVIWLCWIRGRAVRFYGAYVEVCIVSALWRNGFSSCVVEDLWLSDVGEKHAVSINQTVPGNFCHLNCICFLGRSYPDCRVSVSAVDPGFERSG